MYTPPRFRAPDEDAVRAVLAATDFALVVSAHEHVPSVTHLPVVHATDTDGYGVFRAHFARANPHWRELNTDTDVLLVCQGPHGYVSPAWYHERNVPTWDYIAVHAWCRPRLIDDAQELDQLLAELMDRNEARVDTGMRYDAYPPEYVRKQQSAIVGVEFRIERVEATFKLSQNRSAADRESVCAALRATADPTQAALAEAIETYAPKD